MNTGVILEIDLLEYDFFPFIPGKFSFSFPMKSYIIGSIFETRDFMYYGVLGIAVLLFSLQFYMNERYQKENGSSLGTTMVFVCLSNLTGLIILLAVNRLQLTVTPFGLLMATVDTANNLLFLWCSMKALNKINLSLYSVFSMLGGMTLPFLAGLLFYGEPLTLGKGVCFVLVVISLLFTVQKGDKKSGWLYYTGIFVLNGMSGVIAKAFNDGPYPKGSAADFSILSALVTVAGALVLLLFCKERPRKLTLASLAATVGNGSFGRIANYLLLIALLHLPASAQYPMITGGVMVISTLLCLATPNKPKRNDWIAVALSFAGVLALVLIP
mgnify:CR=1 FL=1